jgi:hypothetical protein
MLSAGRSQNINSIDKSTVVFILDTSACMGIDRAFFSVCS